MEKKDDKKKSKRIPSVLTSDVHNEAELIFQILEHKERKCVSYLDTLTMMRGMGMNPTTEEMDELYETMKEPIQILDEIRLEEEKRREKERKAQEKKDPKKEKAEKEKAEKEKAEKEKAGEGEDGEKKKVLTEPAEEIKNINWDIFINCVEPVFKNNLQEESEIVGALKVFEKAAGPKGTIRRDDLITILTHNGESILSPAEVKQFVECFPHEVLEFKEFAQRLQGTYVPPPPPTEEELEEIRQKEKEIADAARKAQEDDLDAFIS